MEGKKETESEQELMKQKTNMQKRRVKNLEVERLILGKSNKDNKPLARPIKNKRKKHT